LITADRFSQFFFGLINWGKRVAILLFFLLKLVAIVENIDQNQLAESRKYYSCIDNPELVQKYFVAYAKY